jgi:hypothetical protein
VTEEPDQTV